MSGSFMVFDVSRYVIIWTFKVCQVPSWPCAGQGLARGPYSTSSMDISPPKEKCNPKWFKMHPQVMAQPKK